MTLRNFRRTICTLVLRCSMRSRGRPESLRLDIAEPMSGVGPVGVARELPVKRRKWRNKVAWIVALAVLLGVLVWVGGGGLDLNPSSHADDGQTGKTPHATPPLPPGGGEEQWPGASDPAAEAESFNGVVGVVLNKSAKQKGLGEAEIEEARLAATNFVREALRGPGDLPPPDPSAMFSAACGLRVQGSLPLYHDKGQRCCKVSHEMLPAGQKLELLQQQKQQDLRDGGAATDGVAAGGNGAAPQARRRVLEEGQRREDIPEPGMPLPGVLRAQRTGTVGGQEVACFPSFIIAGTQKSGTTALTGILEQHPQVMMAGRKELHFFDNKTPNERTAEMYAGNFARFNASQAIEHRAPFVVGEATPFYLASRNACMHMKKLIPDVRLLVLVREPVKRSYSEHQMKVRRVEEQNQVLGLLPLYANKIYDCAVKVLPSSDAASISEREEELVALPQALSAEIGECAGDIGQHGKWMDIMIPFMRRMKARSSKSGKAAGGPTTSAEALEVFREDMTRCFPLKAIAQDMEEFFPGGAWQQGWSRTAAGMDRSVGLPGGAPRMPSKKRTGWDAGRPRFPGGKAPPAALPPGWGEKDPRRRNLKLYQEHGGWVADDLALDDDLDSAEYYWNITAAASEADDGDSFGISAGSDRAIVWDHGRTAKVAREGAAAGNAAKHAADWRGDGVEERPWADYSYGSRLGGFGMEEEALFAGERGFDYDVGDVDGDAAVAGAVDPSRRSLAKKRAVFPGVPWADVWGEWGKDGERVFDETCYQRRERVTPVGEVMRTEMKKLRSCFDKALGLLGGLEALAEANSVAAAEAIDKEISKCFAVTPGISDQYIYRSLYGVQAYHCLKHMPRDQVMFIESDELRDKPDEIMPKIHEHIGVPDYKYPALDQGTIMAELEKKYPDFEKRTGWRLDSDYKEEIPEDLAKEIRDFTAPHMKMFARLTGQSFGDWAINDRGDEEAMVGETERPNELFEEEFHRETTRMAKAKKKNKSAPWGGHKGAADANSDSKPAPNDGEASPAEQERQPPMQPAGDV